MTDNENIWNSPDDEFTIEISNRDHQLPIKKVSHIWTIKSLTFNPKYVGEILQSPKFATPQSDSVKWCMNLYPNGMDESSSEYIGLFLKLCYSNAKSVFAIVDFSLLNSKQEVLCVRSLGKCEMDPKESFGYSMFFKRESLLLVENGVYPNGEITIICDIAAVFVGIVTVTAPQRPFIVNVKGSRLVEDLASLLEKEQFSDVTLRVKEREFHAHKSILAARSIVFSAMFQHEMRENVSNVVDIEDSDGETIESLLHFLYTDQFPALDVKKARNLLAASDKYAIDRLKTLCEEFLSANINAVSAADSLHFADKHNAKDLKRCILDFIRVHAAAVLDTVEWKSLSVRSPNVLLDACKVFALGQFP